MTQFPLTGVKVLDLSRWIAGPSCAMLLGDFGADVIKVEPLRGEESRRVGPAVSGQSAYSLSYNRNKRGMTLDTRNPGSLTVLRRLCEWADVLVENYRPGTMESMGLDDETLLDWNSNLIHVAISGYGGLGDNPNRPTFNAIVEAESGAMKLTGDAQTGPVMSGTFSADHTAGLYAAFSVAAALAGRDGESKTNRIDVSLFHSMLSVLGYTYAAALNGSTVEDTPVNRDSLAAPGNCFKTQDGEFVYIDAGTDKLFGELFNAMGSPTELADLLESDGTERNLHVDLIEKVISRWTGSNALSDVLDKLDYAAVPHGVVRALEDVARSASHSHDAPYVTEEYQGAEVRIPASALTVDGAMPPVRLRPPQLGEHTEDVLFTVCGFTDSEVNDLRETGVC